MKDDTILKKINCKECSCYYNEQDICYKFHSHHKYWNSKHNCPSFKGLTFLQKIKKHLRETLGTLRGEDLD